MKGGQHSAGEVALLQIFLTVQGFTVPITGVYGPVTIAAVNQFQLKYAPEVLAPWIPYGLDGITSTGNVYKTTRWKINNIVCPGSEAFPQLP
jgi:peptidoglycan hydrolase-like protein with peptidoglycan-binding domain